MKTDNNRPVSSFKHEDKRASSGLKTLVTRQVCP